MAKRELRRKVLATIATVLVMCCGLALCIWLLLTSEVFSSTIRWLMLACTVGLGIAIIGLLVCKIQEIRTLSKLVKKEAELPQPASDAPQQPEPELQPLQTLDEPLPVDETPAPAPAPVVQPEQPVVPVMAAPKPVQAAVHTPMPEKQEQEPVEQHHWQPINFKAVDQQYKAAQTARVKAMEDARIAQEQARRLAEQARLQQQAQEQASAAQAAQPVQAPQPSPQHSAREEELLQRAHEQQQARRAEQIRLADAARTGQLPRITNEMIAQEEARLTALARQAEAQRLVQSTAPAPQPVVPVQAAAPATPVAQVPAEPKPAAVPAAAQPVKESASTWGQAWSAPRTEAPAPRAEAPAPAEHVERAPIAWPAPSKPARTTQIPKITDEMIAAQNKARFQTAARTGQLPKITDDMVAAAKSQNRFQTVARTGQLPKITDDMVAATKRGKPTQTLGNFAAHYQKGSKSADSYWKSQNQK